MVFKATFNHASAISWMSVLLVEVTEYPEKTTELPEVTDNFFLNIVVSSTNRHCVLHSQCYYVTYVKMKMQKLYHQQKIRHTANASNCLKL